MELQIGGETIDVVLPFHVAMECPNEFTPVRVIQTDCLSIATGYQSLTVADRHDGGGRASPDHLLLHPGLSVPDTDSLQHRA